jgi:hypothetical protein
MVNYVNLVEKGAKVYVMDVVDYIGQRLTNFELTLGVDILKSDDDYVNYNGDLVISDKEVGDAVSEYISEKYPEIHDYMIDIEL